VVLTYWSVIEVIILWTVMTWGTYWHGIIVIFCIECYFWILTFFHLRLPVKLAFTWAIQAYSQQENHWETTEKDTLITGSSECRASWRIASNLATFEQLNYFWSWKNIRYPSSGLCSGFWLQTFDVLLLLNNWINDISLPKWLIFAGWKWSTAAPLHLAISIDGH